MARSAVVLAGGESRRFGSDKRRYPVEGVPLVLRAVEAIRPVAADLMVAVAPSRPLPDEVVPPADVRVVWDDPSGDGPLAGMLAGLEAARYDMVLVLACDHPWASPATLTALCDVLEQAPATDAAVLVTEGRRQPLAAAYRRRCAAAIRERLAAGDRRAVALLDHLAVVEVTDAPDAARTSRDVDTPSDLAW